MENKLGYWKITEEQTGKVIKNNLTKVEVLFFCKKRNDNELKNYLFTINN